MDLLPGRTDQDWLLDQLAYLLACHGAAFAAQPPLEPNERCFPDAWSANAHGVSLLARRLLTHAGLGNLKVEVKLGRGEGATRFTGIRDGVCRFGANQLELDDPVLVVSAMAREVAMAYRAHHGLTQPERARESVLADVTSVVLGFGVLAICGAESPRSTPGRLGAIELCYLLAVQLVVRRDSTTERRRVAALLPIDRAPALLAACEALSAASLRRWLGLDDDDGSRRLEALLANLPAELMAEEEAHHELPPAAPTSRQRPARDPRRPLLLGAVAGALLGTLLLAPLPVPLLLGPLFAVPGAALAYLLTRKR